MEKAHLRGRRSCPSGTASWGRDGGNESGRRNRPQRSSGTLTEGSQAWRVGVAQAVSVCTHGGGLKHGHRLWCHAPCECRPPCDTGYLPQPGEEGSVEQAALEVGLQVRARARCMGCKWSGRDNHSDPEEPGPSQKNHQQPPRAGEAGTMIGQETGSYYPGKMSCSLGGWGFAQEALFGQPASVLKQRKGMNKVVLKAHFSQQFTGETGWGSSTERRQ